MWFVMRKPKAIAMAIGFTLLNLLINGYLFPAYMERPVIFDPAFDHLFFLVEKCVAGLIFWFLVAWIEIRYGAFKILSEAERSAYKESDQ